MTASAVLAFWAVAFLLIVVPGPDWAFILGAGRAVVPAVGGLVAGYLVLTAAVAAGVGALVAGSPVILTALTVVGGAYLVWHGIATARRPPGELSAAPAARGVFGRGIGVSGLNPKGLLIFVALLPQFTDPEAGWPVGGQLAVLGLTFAATCAVFYLGLGLFARSVLRVRPRVARAVGRFSGGAMAAIGVFLVVERLAT